MNIPTEGKVLLDFYADWCGPCRAMNKTLEEFQNTSEVQLIKLNVDQNRDVAQRYGVRGIPCFVAFNNGIEMSRAVGMQSLQQLNELCA